MARIEKTVFISYRRKDISWALAVYQYLTSQKYDVFFDYTSIPSGDFEQLIVSNIKARAHFILILTPTALDRCSEPRDWLRREIETAMDEKRNIIPLFFDGFSFDSPTVAEKLTGKLADVKRYNGLDVPSGYFPEAMERLHTRYLNVPLSAVLHPVSTEVKKAVKEEKSAANKALVEQKEEIKELIKPAKEKAEKPKHTPVEETADSPLPLGRGVRGVGSNLRLYALGVGILLLVILGISGIRSLIINTITEETRAPINPVPTHTMTISSYTSMPVRTEIIPINTETDFSVTPVPADRQQGGVEYLVQPGDTLAGIAVAFNVSIDEIIAINGLENANAIRVDQVLLLPVSSTPPTSELDIGSTMTGKDGMTLLYVPAGKFTMGSINGDSDEIPVHTVSLDAYWIDRTEVTNIMYAKCVENRGCNEPSFIEPPISNYYWNLEFENYPVIYVSWNDADNYCFWANRRLPTEAEWEKAARGTDARTFPWGEGIDCSNANFDNCLGMFEEVGKYPMGASPYGAYDMAGNVWEWVSDWYSETYYSMSPPSNPLGPEIGQFHVLRGGAYFNPDDIVRSTSREKSGQVPATEAVGFRCAMSASE